MPATDLPPALAKPSIARPAATYFILFASVAAYFPYISLYYQSIGIALPGIGLLAALNAGVSVVAAPAWGAIVDRTGSLRGPLVVAGIVSAAGGAWLTVARDPLAVGLAVVVLAGGSAGLGPMLDTWTIGIVGADRDRYGRARAFGSLAFTIGALAVGVIIGASSPVALFAVAVPGILATGLLAYVLVDDVAARSARRVGGGAAGIVAGLGGIARDPGLILFFAGSVLLWTSVSAVTTFVSVHLVDLGASGALVGLVWTPGALVEVPLMLAFPLLARRLGAERLLALGALAFAARAAAWGLISDPWLFVAAAPLAGIGFALFYVGTVTYVSRAVPANVQATAQGLFSGTAFSAGSIAGSIAGGQIAAALSIAGMFVVAAAGAAIAAGLILAATTRRPTRPVDLPRPH